MPAFRPFKRSASTIAASGLMVLMAGLPAAAQQADALKAMQAGKYDAALQAVTAERQGGTTDPATTFLAAQTFLKMEQPDKARGEFARLESQGDESWKLVGRAGAALLGGDIDAARAAAQQAVEKNDGSASAHYQLGQVAGRQNDWPTAAREFERAAQINGQLAYAHYNAGLAYQKQRQNAKAAEHLQSFLRVAPEAPERQAVAAILRTLG